ncbi:MAG: SDR family oxidoreductase [Deltaproteobacteria bacterium]|nr:SDR family oxidoreductase [Deltaproteobacteria bacterium]
MNPRPSGYHSILVTGSEGYIGRLVLEALAADPGELTTIVALDLRETTRPLPGVIHVALDIRSPELARVMAEHGVQAAVHLAAVVNPGKKPDRELLHSVEVGGTENLLQAALAAGVDKVIYTSSGAAYGYYADNAAWLDENDPIRGNPEFIYSDHKRQVEELLAAWRQEHPELKQLILRPGTILGATAHNQITALFDGRAVVGLAGAESPFVLIWDQDVVGAILRGIAHDQSGIYNLAGDGILTMRQMAALLGKPYLSLPVGLVKAALALLKKLSLTPYGPEQVNFLRYRPVLANRRLKEEFGYVPQKTTRQVFDYFRETRHGA